MGFKNEVCDYILEIGQKKLDNQLHDFKETFTKTLKSNDGEWIRRASKNVQWIKDRIKSLIEVTENLNSINFSNNISKVTKCLSPYGIFCDRYNMYYDISLENKPLNEAAQIMLCEYLNSMQNYFTGKFNNKKCKLTRSISLIYMYHIGLIEEDKFAWYSQTGRETVYSRFIKKYPNTNYIVFGPNENAANYLLDKMVFNDSKQKIGIVKKEETAEIMIAKLFPYTFHITKYSGPDYHYYNGINNNNGNARQSDPKSILFFIKNEDGTLKKTSALHNKIRENKEFIEICNKLSKK